MGSVLCPSLTYPASGTLSLSTNGTQTIATYACAAGYDLNGNSARNCNPDGTWTLAAPNCTCTSPAPPANGQVTANGVIATYRCNQGYSLNGLSTRTCGASGSGWSGSQPACSTCVTLVTPSGGSVNLSTDGINTKVSYTCSLGYTLSGTSSITCRSDGTWDFTPPTCVQCPTLATPSSGTVTLSTNGFTTTASFSCGTGYFLSGAFTLTCNTGGTWSNNPPTCKCNFPTQPNNGQVTLSNSGTVATYRCNTGYTLAGLSSRTCQADGTGWEGSDPICQMCNQLSNPVSGNFTLSTNGTQTRVQYRCNVGTTLHGEITSVCRSDGTWENPSPVCAQCKQLNNPDSGSVALSTDGTITTATFSCVSGYTLNSTGVLACTISGSWDVSSPFCICQSPPLVAHSELDISSDLRTATYTCNVGYVLVGSATRTCQANGTGWDGISPICDSPAVGESTDGSAWNVPITVIVILIVVIVALVVVSIITTYMLCRMKKEKSGQVSPTVSGSVPGSREPSETCPTLPNPVGGSFSLTSNGLTTKANYSCVSGYTLVGSKDQYCQQNKSYTPVAPTCVQCAILNSLGSGNVYITTDGFSSTALYSCVSGYRLEGSSKRTCQANGSWNGTAPLCECVAPSSPLNGALVANGKTANYSCDTGHTLLGTQVRTCNADGTGWSNYDPQCIFCQTLQNPVGGLFTLDTSGTQTFALFYCEVGYTLKGIYKVYCLFTGNWDTIPTCTRCSTLSAPASSTITTTSTGRVTTAKYTCAAGYALNGYNVRTCLPDGTWDLIEPNCTCQAPATIQHGTVSSNGLLATYTCNVGFSLEGVSTRACATDGTGWTGTNPKCNPCKTLSVLTGGTVSMITDGQETKALYKCDVGYTLNGRDNITCRSDGTWDFSQPQCALCATLATPGSGNVSLSTDSKTTLATFTCVSGYYVSGPLTIKCQTNGQWSSNPPSCKCISPVAPGNGSVSVSDTTQGPVANYLCQLGYSINGLVSRLCQNDGSGWKGADPTCNLCSSISTPPELAFTISTNGSTTTGKYACALNYTLSGEHAHQCLGNGSWNNPKPTCVQCSAIHAPLSGTLKLTTDGLQTRATFSCVSGYDLNSTSVLTCKTDGSWDLPPPFCVCQPPPVVQNGDFDLLDDGMVANFSCDDNYELVGPTERYCLVDGTGWNGTQPRCDLIKLPPVVAESTDKTILSIPIGGFIALVVLVLLLLVVLAIIAVCNYMRYRKERHRVGTTLDSGRKSEEEERRFNFESPDLENGKALLISKGMDAKTSFDVKTLKNKSSLSTLNKKKMNIAAADDKDVLSAQSADVEDNKDSLSQDSLLSVTNHVTRDHVTSNGTLPHIPFSAVRLPKLPPMVPKPITESTTTTTKVSRLRRKRRKIDRKEPSSQQQQQQQTQTSPDSETSLPERSTDSRNSTPIEIKMKGTLTPDILSTEHFEYLQPVFCHEAQTPTSSRPTTGTSRATVRTAKSAPGALLDHSIDISESNV